MRVTVVGCGLLGSMFAYPFSSYAVALALDTDMEITLVDFDKVEKRNSPANLMVPRTIGLLKTSVVSDIYAGHGIKAKLLDQRLTSGNMWRLKDTDFIVGATDNIDARKVMLAASRKYGVPYIDMGINDLSGVVAWTVGDYSTMQFATEGIEYKMPTEEEKQPACTLVGSRLISSMVTECAVRSMFIFQSGHDPTFIMNELRGREAQNGDMVGWMAYSGGGTTSIKPIFVGNAEEI